MTWQPIETAPKDGTQVLLYWDGCVIEGEYDSVYDCWFPGWLDDHGCGCCAKDGPRPIAWMPLPAPPQTFDQICDAKENDMSKLLEDPK